MSELRIRQHFAWRTFGSAFVVSRALVIIALRFEREWAPVLPLSVEQH
jgi:hypothetical protein